MDDDRNDINAIIQRIYLQDTQLDPDADSEEYKRNKKIPSCYDKIISNPRIEEENADNNSERAYSIRSYVTDDFKSVLGEDDFIEEENEFYQLKVNCNMTMKRTHVDFVFSNLRIINSFPTFVKLSQFANKLSSDIDEDSEIQTKKNIADI